MIKQFLLACMAMGILAGGVYNEACATDVPTEQQAAANQQRQERELTRVCRQMCLLHIIANTRLSIA